MAYGAEGGIGLAGGLLAAPKDYAPAIAQNIRFKDQERKKKAADEEKEFSVMLEDLNIDPSKYHRTDYENAAELGRQVYSKAFDLYKKHDPNWRNQAQNLFYDWKVQDGALQTAKAIKDAQQKELRSGQLLLTKGLEGYSNFLAEGRTGQYNPEFTTGPFSPIQGYDPKLGIMQYTNVPNNDVVKYVTNDIIGKPTVEKIDPSLRGMGSGKNVVNTRGVYDVEQVKIRAAEATKTPEFQKWMYSNADKLNELVAQNPNADPSELAMKEWTDYVVSLIPEVSKETLISDRTTNINMGSGGSEGSPYIYNDKKVNIPFSYGGEQRQGETEIKKGFTDDFNVNITNTSSFFMGDGVKRMSGAGNTEVRVTDVGIVPVFTKNISDDLKKQFGLTGYGDIEGRMIPDNLLKDPEFVKKFGEYKVYFMGSTLPKKQTGDSGKPDPTGGTPSQDGEFIYGPAGNLLGSARYLGEGKWKSDVHINSTKQLEEEAKKLNEGLKKPETTTTAPKKEIKRSDIAAKASAAGYTVKEYSKMLEDRGIKIVD